MLLLSVPLLCLLRLQHQRKHKRRWHSVMGVTPFMCRFFCVSQEMYKRVEHVLYADQEAGQFWKRLAAIIATKCRRVLHDTIFSVQWLRLIISETVQLLDLYITHSCFICLCSTSMHSAVQIRLCRRCVVNVEIDANVRASSNSGEQTQPDTDEEEEKKYAAILLCYSNSKIIVRSSHWVQNNNVLKNCMIITIYWFCNILWAVAECFARFSHGLGVCPFVHPSVRHTAVLCQNSAS